MIRFSNSLLERIVFVNRGVTVQFFVLLLIKQKKTYCSLNKTDNEVGCLVSDITIALSSDCV